MTGTQRGLCLGSAIAAGMVCGPARELTPLLAPMQAIMLTIVFIETEIDWRHLDRVHLKLFAANLLIPLLTGLLLGRLSPTWQMAGVMAAAAPTAMNAPVITRFLKGDPQHVTGSMLLTNLGSIVAIPLLIQGFHGSSELSWAAIAVHMAGILLPPLVLSRVLRIAFPGVIHRMHRARSVNFWLWIVAIVIAVSKATHYLREQSRETLHDAVVILCLSGAVCALNFLLGARLGGSARWREASQALGQKNTLLTTWVALTYLSPAVALAPIAYILFHNAVNAWQLHRAHLRSEPPVH